MLIANIKDYTLYVENASFGILLVPATPDLLAGGEGDCCPSPRTPLSSRPFGPRPCETPESGSHPPGENSWIKACVCVRVCVCPDTAVRDVKSCRITVLRPVLLFRHSTVRRRLSTEHLRAASVQRRHDGQCTSGVAQHDNRAKQPVNGSGRYAGQ